MVPKYYNITNNLNRSYNTNYNSKKYNTMLAMLLTFFTIMVLL